MLDTTDQKIDGNGKGKDGRYVLRAGESSRQKYDGERNECGDIKDHSAEGRFETAVGNTIVVFLFDLVLTIDHGDITDDTDKLDADCKDQCGACFLGGEQFNDGKNKGCDQPDENKAITKQ